MDNFSTRLKYLRVTSGLTQDKLSSDLIKIFGYPISKSTISQYENGNREPSINMLINLSQYFNCSIDYLVGASDYQTIIDSSEFNSKILLIKLIIDVIPNLDYVEAFELNKIITDYLKSNTLT